MRSAYAVLLSATLLGLGACGGGDQSSADATPAPTTRASSLPATFIGTAAPEVLPASDEEVAQALDAQAKAGVTLFRQPFLWPEIEPEEGKYDFARYDRLVRVAAQNGITVMPIVFGVRPGEAANKAAGARITDTTTMPPKSDARFAAFAVKLVERYGRGGTFWTEHPDTPAKPIAAWQVWNEPNLPAYWGGKPDAAAYAALLKTTAAAIRAADPKVEILTGGLPDSKIGTPLLEYVRDMVKAGAAGSFDTLAVHPYAQSAAAVLEGAVQARDAAEQAGAAGVNLWITEVGWATGGPGSSFTVSETEQAALVVDLLRMAADRAAALRLHGVVYYAWRDLPISSVDADVWGLHTGLVKRDNSVKPALDAFAKTTAELRQ